MIARDRTTATIDAVLGSDGSAVYVVLATQLHLAHQPVHLSAGMRVVDHADHIQNGNASDSRLTGWRQRFHGVATLYLPNDLGWQRCLERFSSILTPEWFIKQAFGVALAGTNTERRHSPFLAS